MISLIRAAWQEELRVPMFVGLSTDGFPQQDNPALINGARIYHMDSGVEYEYSASDKEWYEVEDGSDIISGYYYNGQFYRDEQHSQLLTPKEGRFYYDKEEKKIYLYNGTNYVDVQTVKVGRFLSGWNSTTGLPMSNPTTMPYTYVTGDYYMISAVGETNYRPTGTTYDGTASTVVETEIVDVNDFYFFDGASWLLLENVARVDDVQIDGVSIVSDGIAQIPTATSDTKGVLQLTVIQANTNTIVNTYSVPQLTATQVFQAYNAVVAGKTAIIVDANGEYHFNVISAYTDDDVIYIMFDYMEKMVLKYDGTGAITFVTPAQFAIIDLGSTQYSYHDYVLPSISVNTCRQIYANDVAGIFQILHWTFMGSESNFRVVSSDKIVENYSFDLLVHNRYHCSYTWTDETTGMVNPEVDSLEVDDVTIDKNTNGELQVKDGAITNAKVNSALKATSMSATPSNDKFVTEQALYNYIASGNAGYPRALDSVDLNTVISTGFYSCNVCTNRPTENNGAMIVVRNTVNTNTLVQIYFSYVADEMWIRHRDNSIWKNWVKVTKSTDIGTMAVLYDAVQTLTDAQKAQARANINAAAPDGYYGNSGGVMQYSTNFLGRNAPQNASNVVFRPTASNFSGSAWSAGSISGQTATIDKIKGKTLVWNQQFDIPRIRAYNSSYIRVTRNSDNSLTATCIDDTGTSTYLYSIRLSEEFPYVSGHKYMVSYEINSSFGRHALLSTKGGWTYTDYPITVNEWSNVADIYSPSADSTLFYMGITNATSQISVDDTFSVRNLMMIDLTQMFGAGNEPATVKEFRAMFPLNYYDYNEGELISFNAAALKTVGFNQWDASNPYKAGYAIDASGNETANANFNIDEIEVFPSTTYHLHYTNRDSVRRTIRIHEYDANRNWLRETLNSLADSNKTTDADITTSANAHYIRISHVILIENPCINIAWSGVRDGDTEDYWQRQLSLPIAQYFPDGMKSVGAVYDELTKDKAIQRVGSRVYQSGDEDDAAVVTDKTTTHYALAEPVETPITSELNLTYRCDDFGTEMLLPQSDDEPVTTPMDADIVYQIDYEAQVRNNDQLNITKSSMDNFIASFNASGLGTITQTYNPNTKQYEYTVTAPQPEPTEGGETV